MSYDVLLVAAALDELSKESQVGSFDNAQIIVNAFHHLKPRSLLVTEMSKTKKSGSTQGQTNLGNVSLDHQDEEVTNVRGVKYTRVGKWKIWREEDEKRGMLRIQFVHFLSQGVHDGLRDREFFVEYDKNLAPKGFAYMGGRKELFHFWFVTIYTCPVVVVFGEVCSSRERITITLGF